MRAVPLVALLAVLTSCSSYREVAEPPLREPLIFAEYLEGGMWLGKIDDSLSIANWELRVANDGTVQQRTYDRAAAKWRTFVGKQPLRASEVKRHA